LCATASYQGMRQDGKADSQGVKDHWATPNQPGDPDNGEPVPSLSRQFLAFPSSGSAPPATWAQSAWCIRPRKAAPPEMASATRQDDTRPWTDGGQTGRRPARDARRGAAGHEPLLEDCCVRRPRKSRNGVGRARGGLSPL